MRNRKEIRSCNDSVCFQSHRVWKLSQFRPSMSTLASYRLWATPKFGKIDFRYHTSAYTLSLISERLFERNTTRKKEEEEEEKTKSFLIQSKKNERDPTKKHCRDPTLLIAQKATFALRSSELEFKAGSIRADAVAHQAQFDCIRSTTIDDARISFHNHFPPV